MTFASLFGLKPAIETVRDLLESVPFAKQFLSNEMLLLFARITELIFESSPETLIQTVALLRTDYADQTFLQYIGLLSSIVAIGLLVTLGDRDFDTVPERRAMEPLIYGYVSR